jgi:starch synthase (maltosyl-transferring)
VKVVEHLLELGFTGFRCDAAYQIPAESWRRLIRRIKGRSADVVFAAETLGCRPEQTLSTAAAGFDWIFNSSKWWDFESPWLQEQYELTRKVTPSIGFPESHDTERLFAETGASAAALKQRYVFTALFSAGVMIPIGFEYGFRKRLHVVDTSPADWEPPNVELADFIRSVNQLKRFTVFAEECDLEFAATDNPRVLVMHKRCARSGQEGLVLLNKDTDQAQQVRVDSFSRYLTRPRALRSVLPEGSLPPIAEPFEHTLGPGAAVVLVSDPMQELQPTECR